MFGNWFIATNGRWGVELGCCGVCVAGVFGEFLCLSGGKWEKEICFFSIVSPEKKQERSTTK